MARKTTVQPQKDGVTTVGLDIGYGEVKVVTAKEALKFPSVYARATDMKFTTAKTATEYPGETITDDEGKWIVGFMAQKHAPISKQRMLKGRTADESNIGHVARLRLAKVALGKLFPGRHNGEIVHIRIATGLPVDHMPGAAEFKATFYGQHRIITDATDFVANITEVMVMPQPYGTIYREMITETGKLNPCHDFTRTGVVDIGRYTIDVTVDDDGEYLDQFSGSAEGGVFTLQERIGADYYGRFGQKPLLPDVETIIRSGCVRVRGKLEDFTEVLRIGVNELSEATLNLITDKWQGGANVDVIYVSGGGASLVFNDIKAAYPQAQLTEEAQLANAQGYFNYAMFTQREAE